MPDLANLRANTARLSFSYVGATFTAFYRPLDLDERTQTARRAMAENDDLRALYAELARVVLEWDVSENGAPVPTTPEGFQSAGTGICLSLWNALLVDLRNPTLVPGWRPASPTLSSNGSRPTDAWAPTASPTTTPSSATPSGSASPLGTSPDYPSPPVTSAGSSGPTA